MDKIIQCDVTQGIPLSDKSVHCVITSPPYWGLRDYGVPGQLGLEKTPAEYIERMVAVFREVWRILRDDGTLWLNMGDSYSGSGCGNDGKQEYLKKSFRRDKECVPKQRNAPGLKPKDLCMMPHRLAMALQKDGWWIRSDIVWHKPNPMPESVTDRPTKSHEYIFLLAKRAKYFYDAEAIREEQLDSSIKRAEYGFIGTPGDIHPGEKRERVCTGFPVNPAGRNKRSVWTIPTQSYSEAHFATFPEKLVEPCIKAGTSEKGCCAECGAPWVRVVEKGDLVPDSPQYKPRGTNRGDGLVKNAMTPAGDKQGHPNFHYENKTMGWKPTCRHVGDPVPAVVYDPFMGSGTVGLVAYKLNRHYIGTELSPEYIDMAERRIGKERDKYELFE